MINFPKIFIKRILEKLAPRVIPFVRRTIKISYYLIDIRSTWKYMHWSDRNTDYGALSAELIFQYHKLEKGLCMPGPKRFFGEQPALATLALVGKWREQNHSTENPIYLGAIETLRAYANFVRTCSPPSKKILVLIEMLETLLSAHDEPKEEYRTPIYVSKPHDLSWDGFSNLMLTRRSVRDYLPKPVNINDIKDCVNVANLSPSVCNRQTCRVRIYEDPRKIADLLTLQNGNRGFGHLLSTLLIVTADARYFFDASERNQPFIDGGLLSMSLVLALHSKGISSCCLNWCVSPNVDKKAHVVGDIPENEKIIMYIAIGYTAENTQVPKSERRSISEIAI